MVLDVDVGVVTASGVAAIAAFDCHAIVGRQSPDAVTTVHDDADVVKACSIMLRRDNKDVEEEDDVDNDDVDDEQEEESKESVVVGVLSLSKALNTDDDDDDENVVVGRNVFVVVTKSLGNKLDRYCCCCLYRVSCRC